MSAAIKPFFQKLKNGYSKYEQFIRKFAYTDLYLLLVSVITVIGWATKCAPFGITTLTIIACLVLIGIDDVLPLTINIFGAMLVIYTSNIGELLSIWPVLLLFIPSFAVFILKNCRHKFRLGKMFYPQIAISLVLLLGGLGVISGTNYLRALPTALLLGLGDRKSVV